MYFYLGYLCLLYFTLPRHHSTALASPYSGTYYLVHSSYLEWEVVAFATDDMTSLGEEDQN